MKKINLIVLLVDSVPANIYMALLSKYGYQPEKIVRLNIQPQVKFSIRKKIVKQLVKSVLRKVHSRTSQGIIQKNHYKTLAQNILCEFGLCEDDLKNWSEKYPATEIETLNIESIDALSLKEYLMKQDTKTVLFTGGGILKQELLSVSDLKFIHIHPGIVPDIRGADCFFGQYY